MGTVLVAFLSHGEPSPLAFEVEGKWPEVVGKRGEPECKRPKVVVKSQNRWVKEWPFLWYLYFLGGYQHKIG